MTYEAGCLYRRASCSASGILADSAIISQLQAEFAGQKSG